MEITRVTFRKAHGKQLNNKKFVASVAVELDNCIALNNIYLLNMPKQGGLVVSWPEYPIDGKWCRSFTFRKNGLRDKFIDRIIAEYQRVSELGTWDKSAEPWRQHAEAAVAPI